MALATDMQEGLKQRRPGGIAPMPTESPRLDRFKAFLPWVIIGLGVILRLRMYLFNRALLMDEQMLALNLINRSFAELWEQLDHNQGAPIGFLLVSKAALDLLGRHEMALRLVPLLAGIASLVLFYWVARRLLSPFAVIVALILFAFGEFVVDYSGQLKQYSTDVFFTLAIVAVALRQLHQPLTFPRATAFALLGAAVIWFSHASVIAMGGVGIALGTLALARRDWRRVAALVGVAAVWSGSLALCYFISLRGLANNDYLLQYWHNFFMPLPPLARQDLRWFMDKPIMAFGQPVGLTYTGLGAFAFFCGAVALYRRDRAAFWVVAAPILLTLFLSGLHLYPFGRRLILFLVPSLIVPAAAGVDFVRRQLQMHGRAFAYALPVLLLMHPVMLGVNRFASPPPIEEIREVLQYLGEHKRPDDTLHAYYWAKYPLEFYGERYGIEEPYTIGQASHEDWRKYMQDIQPLRGQSRVWFLFSNVHPGEAKADETFFLTYLDSIGRRLDEFRAREASVFLYDLSAPGFLETPPETPE